MSSKPIYDGPRVRCTETFIRKARFIHGDLYDYSESEYTGNDAKINITCPVHGEFLQKANNHLSGKGCMRCVRSISDTESFIQKAKSIHGEDRYDYSKVEYVSALTKVDIICPLHGHGMFSQTPSRHTLRSHGCPKCKGEQFGERMRSTTEEFIEKAVEIHGDKFDYSLVDYFNNTTKVLIICPHHGEFWQTPDGHLVCKHGCSKCAPTSRYNKDAAGADCCVYFITFEVDGVTYEKIGITSRSVELRFRYEEVENLQIIYEKWGKYDECWDTETFLLEKFTGDRYRTGVLKGKVGGWSETFPLGTLCRETVWDVLEGIGSV